MKYTITAAVAALAFAAEAAAQAPTAPPVPATPPAPPPPSTCPAYPAAPTVPTAEEIKNQRDLNAGTEKVNAYLSAYQTVQQCRLAEIERLKTQLNTRVDEARESQTAALAFRATWQATRDAVVARGAQKQRDSRSGRN